MQPLVPPQQARPPLILSLDIGSSSVRASLFDAAGRTVDGIQARRAHALQTDSSGAAVAAADEVIGLTFQCIDEALALAGSLAGSIAAVAGCSFVGNLLGVDECGLASTPLITYADTRAAADAELLKRELDEETFHQRTGVRFHPSYGTAQLHWLRRARSEEFRTRRALGVAGRVHGDAAFRQRAAPAIRSPRGAACWTGNASTGTLSCWRRWGWTLTGCRG